MPQQKASSSLPYTAAPYHLILADLALWLRITFVFPPGGIPSLLLPIGPFNSGTLDELYPTFANIWALVLQLVLSLVQLLFLLWLLPAALGTVPPFVTGYSPIWITLVVGFAFANRWVSRLLLNGTGSREYHSTVQLSDEETQRTQKEKWIFVNGVAAGNHWMQNNIDRLALTFRRPIYGIHNETRGIVFDLIECILERTLGWATPSTRIVYARLMEIVSNAKYERIILILHSQGAIEGGLALDWLFATMPAAQLSRLEVYTFGSAANHFNNPVYTMADDTGTYFETRDDGDGRILKYIEHYANSDDYVSQFGILNYRPIPGRRFSKIKLEQAQNRYAGRLFIRYGSGHQFNGNYLDNLFTFDETRTRVLDSNPFMEAKIDEPLLASADIASPKDDVREIDSTLPPASPTASRRISFNRRVRDLSRLWTYRNGGIPDDEANTNTDVKRDENDLAVKSTHVYDKHESIEMGKLKR